MIKKKKIVFIVNPVSGRGKKADIEPLILSTFDKEKYDLKIQHTEYKYHAAELSKQAVDENTDIIVAVGGDGTINEVASQMINSTSIMGIIPGGSGNGLARHLGIPFNRGKALKLIKSEKNIKIDTATINDKPFVSIAGVGFDALVAKHFAKSNQRGFLSYFRLVASKYPRYKPKKYTIIIDKNTKIKTRALFLSFANSNQFGYNTAIAPNAKLNDGKLDLCIVKKPILLEIPLIANLLLLKKIHLSPHVNIIPVKNIIVKQTKNRVSNIDGEAINLGKVLDIKIKALSLNIIIP